MFGLVRLIVLLGVLAALYWAYYLFGAADPNDRLGVEINTRLPPSLRSYGCRTVEGRFGGTLVPAGCEDLEFRPPAPGKPAP